MEILTCDVEAIFQLQQQQQQLQIISTTTTKTKSRQKKTYEIWKSTDFYCSFERYLIRYLVYFKRTLFIEMELTTFAWYINKRNTELNVLVCS